MASDLIVRVDHQAADTVAHDRSAGFLDYRLDRGRLVVEADQEEPIIDPFYSSQQLRLGHAPRRSLHEWRADEFFGKLGDVLLRRVLKRADGKAPAVALRQIDGERVGEGGEEDALGAFLGNILDTLSSDELAELPDPVWALLEFIAGPDAGDTKG